MAPAAQADGHRLDGCAWLAGQSLHSGHGLQDNLCTPVMGRAARDIILELNSEGGKAKNERAQEYGGNGPHVCYDYTTVEERFPVRWCTQNGGHIWDHKDPGSNQSWVPKTTWDFFNKF